MKIIYNRVNKRGYYRHYTPASWGEIGVMFLICAILLIICVCCDGIHNANVWNDGHCPNCGSEWRYVEAVGHRYSTSYIYVCDKCNYSIECDYEPNWNEVGTTTNTLEITEETESSIEDTTTETTFEEGEWVT